MEIKKESISLNETGVKVSSNVMAEGDIIIPDINPDIREVLIADAKANVTSAEYRNGKLNVSGTISLNVLYKPDEAQDSAELKSLNSEFMFSDALDAQGGEDLKYCVSALVEHIGFTLVNSRKLSVKVIVSLSAKGYRNHTLEPVSQVLGDGVCCRDKSYNVYMPILEEETNITISDILTVPEHMPDIEEILKVDGCCRGAECKIMNGKVMVRGELCMKTLYTASGEGEKIQLVTHEIPFAELVEAENVDENCTVSVIYDLKSVTPNVRGDVNGDTKIISADIVIGAKVKASKSEKRSFAEDCYGIYGKVNTSREKISVSEYISSENTETTLTQTVKMPKNVKLGDVISVSAKPVVREKSFDDGNLHIKGGLVSFLIYREDGEQGQVRSSVTETDFDWKMRAQGENLSADADVWTEDVLAHKVNSDEAEVKVTLGVNAKILKNHEINIITDCELDENEVNTPERPSIVIYFVEEGDSLWSIAKKYGTTVEKIKSANNMESDSLCAGNKILIPKAC